MFALCNADRTDQHWLSIGVALNDVGNNSIEFGVFGFENLVSRIDTHDRTIRWDRHHLQVVGVHEFGSFGLCRTRHTRELVIHAEIVLQCDRGKRLVFFFDLDAFFGFNRLVNTFTPAATFKNAARELVNDFYFAALNDVVLVAAIQLFSL